MERKPYRVVTVLSHAEGLALDRKALKEGISRSALIRLAIRIEVGLGPEDEEVPEVSRWKWRKDRRAFRAEGP